MSKRAEKLRQHIGRLYVQTEAAGNRELAAKLLRMDAALANNQTSAAMNELLPDVQRIAKEQMPPVLGFVFLFRYRLEMLYYGLQDAIGT